MNQETLSNIVNQTEPIESNVSMDLVQLCNTFPYFPVPFILLGKQYSQKKDFRTDSTIFQAALRVQSREWLFNYINAQSIKKADNSLPDIEENPNEISVPTDIPQEPNDLNQTTVEIQDSIVPEVKIDNNSFMEQMNGLASKKVDPIIEIVTNEFNTTETHSSTTEVDFNNEIESFLFTPTIESIDVNEDDIEVKSTGRSLLFNPEIEEKLESPKTTEKEPQKIFHSIGYNIEDYFEAPTEPIRAEAANQENDFFSWLNADNKNQGPINKPENTTKDSLIEKFIKDSPSITRPKQEFFSPERAMKKSEVLDFAIATETLAKIYLKQGYPDKAIKVYEQLELKIPEKMSYFAALKDKIKEEHNL